MSENGQEQAKQAQQDLFKEFMEAFQKESKGMKHVNLIISGKTGVGKSTLINAAFRKDLAETGVGAPITPEIRLYEEDGFPLRIYDTMGLELSADRQEYAVNEIKKLCEEKKLTGDIDQTIHVMWYCVHGNGARFEPYEANFVNEVASEMPVVIVLTQTILKNVADKLKSEIEKQNTKARNVIVVRAQPYKSDDDQVLPAFGVDQLVEYTYSLLPEAVKKAWVNAQGACLKLKREKSHAIVLSAAAASFGEGYIPLPFSDCIALVPTQVGMIAAITAVYGLSLSKAMLTGIVTSLLGTAGTTLLGRTLAAALLKCIPAAGQAIGGTISGATASALTIALGEAYIQVMDLVFKGEISESDIVSGKVTGQLTTIFKENLQSELHKR